LNTDATVVTEQVRRLLRGSKDAAIGFSARSFLNTRLRGIGEMTELSIDTKKRTIHMRLELLGEAEPIEIHIQEYRLKRAGEATMLTVVNVTASRQWLTEALRQFVVGRSFTIPPGAGAVLSLLA
jgi:hypothetical protein